MSAESLSLDCIIHLFSYLEVPDLLRVAQVNKAWNEAAETTFLWRNMCLKRWAFCNISVIPGMHSWKKYYLHRSNLESKMKSGQPSVDYTCKAIRGHNGVIYEMAYLSEKEHMFATGKVESTVCTVSSDGTVRAWNIQEGKQIWSSPQQGFPLVGIITFPAFNLAATADTEGTIKLWHGTTGEELSTFSVSSIPSCMVAYTIKNNPFLMVGTEEGSLHTLSATDLSQVLYKKLFQNCGIQLSLCSPNGQWILVCPGDAAFSPKVFNIYYATQPEDDDLMLSSPLPITNYCRVMCWLPAESARIAILYKNEMFHIDSFDMVIEKSKYKKKITAKQIASFTLPAQQPVTSMKGFGKQTLLIAAGPELTVYSLSGTVLMAFKDHHKIITSIWVDPFHVVTSSMDFSLRVYFWKNSKSSLLTSCYNLLGGSHRWSSGFRSVACDDVSIVGIVAGIDGKDSLRAYSFHL
ncbi:F-box/WD repeat-containing protein 12 isoform X2 [Notechis scutatus]|uniref:F-box/WD repeat-containing protein 12 isoform X2 n=1 Tax=Notechis scutatus TaxID=8663 RepID=A0A6J1URG4_9SAUR|nr:F-box/WD repeat-containing protein 12 isoform X2 [Notechis scutatus]